MSTAPVNWWNSAEITVASTSVDVTKLDPLLVGFMRSAGHLHSYLFAKPLVITSGNDGNHLAHSAHYLNFAVDIRSRELTPDQAMLFSLLLSFIAPLYKCVVFDERATASQHWHVQTAASAGA